MQGKPHVTFGQMCVFYMHFASSCTSTCATPAALRFASGARMANWLHFGRLS